GSIVPQTIPQWRLPMPLFSPRLSAGTRTPRRRPRLETLEDRTVPAAFIAYPVPTPNSGPFNLTLGADGNVWFTEVDNLNKIGRITAAGQITEFILPTANAEPFGIGTGPDGNVWFGESV